MRRRRRSPPLPDLARGRDRDAGELRRRPSTSPSPPPGTPTPPSSGPWRKTASAAPPPTPPPCPPFWTGSTSSRRASTCASPRWGEVVNGLMCEQLPRHRGREVHRPAWRRSWTRWSPAMHGLEGRCCAEFYGGFDAESGTGGEGHGGRAPEGARRGDARRSATCAAATWSSSPARFGRFLACPGYPECNFTKPLVVEMPGRCPKCGGRHPEEDRQPASGYTYYGCEHNCPDEAKCDFMTWDVPVKDDCPVCGQTMFKKSGRGFNKPFCINPDVQQLPAGG